MAQVVYTNVEQIEDLPKAIWREGVQMSYAETQKMADLGRGISLIGRQGKDGRVDLCYAKSRNTEWRVVGGWHMTLAKFFLRKYNERPEENRLNVFFESIDDDAAANALRQIVSVEVGATEKYIQFGRVHSAINGIGADLTAMGVPYGDWAFIPMRNTWAATITESTK